MTEAGVSIGRKAVNKVVITHSSCSGEHCIVYADGLADISTNGTYLHVKNIDEVREGIQSHFVPFDHNLEVYVLDYLFKLQ